MNVRIELAARASVLIVPRGAISFDQSTRRYVFVVESGSPNSILHKREVHLGISDSTTYEVLSGVNEGDVVAILGNLSDPTDGMKVRVEKPE